MSTSFKRLGLLVWIVLVLGSATAGAARLVGSRGRDRLSAKLFNGRTTTEGYDDPRVMALSRRLFGRVLEARDWAELVGAPDGAVVEVNENPSERNAVSIETLHPYYKRNHQTLRAASKTHGMKGLTISMDVFDLNRGKTRSGLGTRITAMQILGARRLGVRFIDAYASAFASARQRDKGYYVWPRLGFNTVDDLELTWDAPPRLKAARDINQLMKIPGGASWWNQHGWSVHVYFKLDRRSAQSEAHVDYLKKKGIRVQ
jgi:hypothetical protein